jgi:hypothetical protein
VINKDAVGFNEQAKLTLTEACTKLVMDYVWFLDHVDADANKTALAFADLFTEDAVLSVSTFKLEETEVKGREEIANRYLLHRNSNRFLHLMTNIRVTPISDRIAIGTNYVSFFVHPNDADMNHSDAAHGVGEYRDRYQLTDDGWKFSSRRSLVRLHSQTSVISAPVPE